MKRAALALLCTTMLTSPVFAACSNPLNIKDASAATIPLSVTQGADGNCQSNLAPQVWYPGSSNNGLLTTAVTLMTTELNSITNAGVAVTSTIFTNASTGQARVAEMFFNAGTTGAACAAGASLAGWFLQSSDGGTTFEATSVAPARAPDFLFALPATTLVGLTPFKANGQVNVPALKFKVMVQNNCGTNGTLAATGNTVTMVPVGFQN